MELPGTTPLPGATAPTGWQLVRRDASGSTMAQSVYVHVATAAEPSSVTWRLKSARGATAILLAYDGIDAVSPVLASSGRITVGSQANQEDMVRAINTNGIQPVIDRSFGLEDLAEAFRLQESQKHFGKICLSF